MNRKAIIIGISGKTLTIKEKKLLFKYKPWGVILFSRNISSFKKTKKLIKSIRSTIMDKNFPILIDEEGGNVTRLSKLFDNKIYSQSFFGKLYKKDPKTTSTLYINYINSICSIFKILGININTVPVLDILKSKTHKIIINRSYSSQINIIKKLSKICLKSYKKNKIGNVIKHIPGHGSSSSDSHKSLPIVKNRYIDLKKNDFYCFKNLNSLFAMTAHIIYSRLDKKNTCTHSKIIINKIIRKQIGFKGILISDDIGMKALKFDLITNAKKSLQAGCNLVLHCSGKYNESLQLLKKMPLIDTFTIKKTSEFYKFLR